MKVAIVHDWITNLGGGEECLKELAELFPEAPIYTLVSTKESLQRSNIKEQRVTNSFIQKLPFGNKKYRSLLALFPLAIEQFDLSEFDVIISSSSSVAKGVLVHSNQLHICYCHSPIRYAWDLHHQYLKEAGLHKGVKGFIAKSILHYIRNWDVSTHYRVDEFIANSEYISKRIKRVYGRSSTVIYPPVRTDHFQFSDQKEDFYLTVSRLVPYKKVDLIAEAFSKLPNHKLVIIGDGPQMKKVKKISSNVTNIEVKGYQEFEIVKDHMQRAKGFVFAAEEDFGIVPVEAQACGTPVICFGKGGTLETVKNEKTGVYFQKQTPDSIIKAIEKFEKIDFDYKYIREHSQKFKSEKFRNKIKNLIQKRSNAFFENNAI